MAHPPMAHRPMASPARRVAMIVAFFAACGRTEIPSPPPTPPPPDCRVDADCPGHEDLCKTPVICMNGICVGQPVVSCNDNDPCTTDTCDPRTGACSYTHATPDQDNDGYYAPLPGYAPGSPGSCGDDCDDTNPNVHPGGREVCDGVDNDCDGIVDNGAIYLPSGAGDVRVNADDAPASPGGLAWDGTSYEAAYTGTTNGFNVFTAPLTPAGKVVTPPGQEPFALVNADASGGTMLWIGDRYATTWQDRRTGNYEVWFNTLDGSGKKRMADVQITDAPGFSVNPAMAWNNVEFLLAWQDDRDGAFDVYAQRVRADGTLEGGNLKLTTADGELDNESPAIANGLNGVGLAWSLGDATSHIVSFRSGRRTSRRRARCPSP